MTGRQYHGVNLLLLGLSRYTDHRWLTYRQARELGGHVRTGEKASLAVFWKQLEIERNDGDSEEVRKGQIPLLRHYYLFNVEQCDGLDLPGSSTKGAEEPTRIEAAESAIRAMPDPPRLHEGCRAACYYPLIDVVHMPPISSFKTADAYYATLFHELVHATGHPSRLNREGVTQTPQFGSDAYGREELVAELGSGYCCATIGLDNSVIDDAASYIDGWLAKLRSDSKLLVRASGQASRAADFILGRTSTVAEPSEAASA
jgi:antirestriction protein ArdC